FGTYPIISMRWTNVVPDSFEGGNVESTVFRKPSTASTIIKAAFQPKLLRRYSYAIAQGNHSLIDTTLDKAIYAKAAFELFHVPLRSRVRTASKLELQSAAYEAMKNDRNPAHALHYHPLRVLATQHGYSDDVLAYMAAHYGETDETVVDNYVP